MIVISLEFCAVLFPASVLHHLDTRTNILLVLLRNRAALKAIKQFLGHKMRLNHVSYVRTMNRVREKKGRCILQQKKCFYICFLTIKIWVSGSFAIVCSAVSLCNCSLDQSIKRSSSRLCDDRSSVSTPSFLLSGAWHSVIPVHSFSITVLLRNRIEYK